MQLRRRRGWRRHRPRRRYRRWRRRVGRRRGGPGRRRRRRRRTGRRRVVPDGVAPRPEARAAAEVQPPAAVAPVSPEQPRAALPWAGPLGFSIGPQLFLRPGLRHDLRRGLRMRWRADEVHGRESGRGKQRETKVCHVICIPGKMLSKEAWCDQFGQTLGRIVATREGDAWFISENTGSSCPVIHRAFRR